MSGRDNESQEVMSAAQRYVNSGIRSDLDRFSLSILRKTDYQLGQLDMNTGYRKAIQDRIKELEKEHIQASVIEVKPNIYGLGINLNEALRRFKAWWNE